MSGQHDLPESFVLDWMRKYEDKVLHLEELNANELVAENKRHTALFSDAQSSRVEEQIARAILAFAGSELFATRVAKEVKYIAGSEALRFWVCVVGAFLVGAVSVIVKDYFKAH
jgi:transposase-like protein